MDKLIIYFLYFYAFCSTISMAGASIGIYGALIFGIVQYIRRPFEIKVDKVLLYAFGFFLFSEVLSLISSYNYIDTLQRVWRDFYRFGPFFLVLFFVKDEKHRYGLAFMMFLSVAVSDLVAVWQGLHGNYRAEAFTDNPLRLAGMIIQLIPLMLVLGLLDKTLSLKIRFGLLALTLLTFVALLFNGSRGAWIAILFSMIVFGIIQIRKKPLIFLGIVLVLILLGGFIITNPAIKERFNSIDDLQANRERILIWKSSLQMFYDHPLTGVGVGNFGRLYQTRYISPHATQPTLSHAHNSFLHVLAEAGLIGFLALMFMFGYLVVLCYRCFKDESNSHWGLIGLLMITAWLVHGLTEYNLGSAAVMRMLWLELGLVFIRPSKVFEMKSTP